jgi:hypothetical protein
MQDDYPTARSLTLEALAFARQTGDKMRVHTFADRLSSWAEAQGDYTEAHILYAESLAMMWQMGNNRAVLAALPHFAGLALTQGQAERAVRLYGATEALQEAMGTAQTEEQREHFEQEVAKSREALNEQTFATAWAEGQAMPLEDAIEYALAES